MLIMLSSASVSSVSSSWFDPIQRYNYPQARAPTPSKRLCYVPGLDGTSGSPFVQWPAVAEAGFGIRVQDVRSSLSTAGSFDATVDEVVSELSVSASPTLLMGESYGAVVAAAAALKAPDSVSGLILVNPATAFSKMPALQRDAALLRSVPEAIFPAASFALLGRKTFDIGFILNAVRDIVIEKKLDALRESDPELAGYFDAALAELTQQVSQLPPRDFMCARLEHLADGCAQLDSCLASLAPPVLVIAGTADKLLESDVEAARLQRVLGADQCWTHLVDGAGHAGTLDQRCELAAVIGRWCADAGIEMCSNSTK